MWNPYYNNMTLLCHFDGNFTDSSSLGRTLTATSVTADGTGRFGAGSSAKPASSGSPRLDINAQLVPGTSSFTHECWVYSGINGTNRPFITQGTSGGTTNYQFYIDSTNFIKVYALNNTVDITSAAVSANTWYHCRVIRSGSTWTLTVTTTGGAQTVYTDSTGLGTIYTGNTKLFVTPNDSTFNTNDCLMDELVFFNVALSTTYALPTEPYPDYKRTDTMIPRKDIATKRPLRVNQNVTVSRMGL